jgi:NADH:ubiquinone oxidoreductase subunit H
MESALQYPLDGYELPIGLSIIALILFSVAGINLITKEVATIWGVAFTAVFFTIFMVSERLNQRKLDSRRRAWTSSD